MTSEWKLTILLGACSQRGGETLNSVVFEYFGSSGGGGGMGGGGVGSSGGGGGDGRWW